MLSVLGLFPSGLLPVCVWWGSMYAFTHAGTCLYVYTTVNVGTVNKGIGGEEMILYKHLLPFLVLISVLGEVFTTCTECGHEHKVRTS